MEGIIFDIKRFAIHDGPGIRQTVFFKGCPLSCWWCHNPESRNPKIEVYDLGVCEQNDIRKSNVVGRTISVDDLMENILRDRIFYEHSGGGVTFSGGEPSMQFDFLHEMLSQSKAENIHTALDTTGFIKASKMKTLQDKTDLFLYDIKHLDDGVHKMHTGVSNKLILDNLEMLNEGGSRIFIRFPLIPGVNDSEKDLTLLAEYIYKLENVEQINLLPYHKLGNAKNARFSLGKSRNFTTVPAEEDLVSVRRILSSSQKPVITGG